MYVAMHNSWPSWLGLDQSILCMHGVSMSEPMHASLCIVGHTRRGQTKGGGVDAGGSVC